MSRRAALPFAVALVLVACATGTPPETPVDAAGASHCPEACAWRKAHHCLEAALEAACVPVCEENFKEGLTRTACILKARTPPEFALCHVRCGAP